MANEPTPESLIAHFERLHLHHVSSKHKTRTFCRQEFMRQLKKWKAQTRVPRRSHTYVDACTDRRKQDCRYVVRVFDHHSPEGKIQFAHEVRTLQVLSDRQVDFIPPVHTAFLCGDYGLLVQSKWHGDIMDLLFEQKEDRVETVFQRAHHMAQVMMAELHQVGLCYGQNTIDFRNLIFCRQPKCPDVMKSDAGFHLGLQDWRGARPVTREGAEQDLHQIRVLFMELAHLVRALRHKENILPPHLPHAMKTKAAKLKEW